MNDGKEFQEKIIANKFQLQEVLGQGASSTVYKARHTLLDQDVAIKVFAKDFNEDSKAAERFKNEASLLSSFSHPNIPKFLAFGETEDGQPFMAFEYVQGRTLAAQIIDAPLSENELLLVIVELCEALDYAHSRGIIHRDIKPSNVIMESLSETTVARLLDFGIFKNIADTKQKLTKTGFLLGSFNYMSPEQCKSQALDARSDIYSLGCLMYEAMVGKAPMDDDNEFAIINNHNTKVLKSVPAKAISRAFENIILKCLEKDPVRRFQTVLELQREIQRIKGQPVDKRGLSKFPNTILLSILLLVSLALVAFVARNFFASNAKDKALQVPNKRFGPSRIPDLSIDPLTSIDQCEDWLGSGKATDLHEKLWVQWTESFARLKSGYLPNIQYQISDEDAEKRLKSDRFYSAENEEHRKYDLLEPLALTRLTQGSANDGFEKWLERIPQVNSKNYHQMLRKYCSTIGEATFYLALGGDHERSKRIFELAQSKFRPGFMSTAKFDLEMAVCRSKFYAGKSFNADLKISEKTAEQLLSVGASAPEYDQWAALYCESGLQKELIKYVDKHFSSDLPRQLKIEAFDLPSTQSLGRARLKVQESRAELELKQWTPALKLAESVRDECGEMNAFNDPIADVAESVFLKARFQTRDAASNTTESIRYLSSLQSIEKDKAAASQIKADGRRSMLAAPTVCTEILFQGVDESTLYNALKALISEDEARSTETRLCCSELKIALGKFALLRKHFDAAKTFFQMAVADTARTDSIKATHLYLLSQIYLLQTNYASNTDGREIEEIIERKLNILAAEKGGSNLPRNLDFFYRFLKLKHQFEFEPTENKRGENKQLNQLERLLTQHSGIPIPVIDSYSDALVFFIENSAGTTQEKFSSRIDKISDFLKKFESTAGFKKEQRQAQKKSFISMLQAGSNDSKLSPNLSKRIKEELAIQSQSLRVLETEYVPNRLFYGDPFRPSFWLEARIP